MPTYDYACTTCGGFDAVRTMSQRNDPAPCPVCDAPSPRVFVAGPQLPRLSGETRRAFETNERAAHAPISSKDYGGPARLRHPSGCGCCSPARRGATVTAANGAKTFPSKRPWMISH